MMKICINYIFIVNRTTPSAIIVDCVIKFNYVIYKLKI